MNGVSGLGCLWVVCGRVRVGRGGGGRGVRVWVGGVCDMKFSPNLLRVVSFDHVCYCPTQNVQETLDVKVVSSLSGRNKT